MIFGSIAGFGLTFISEAILAVQFWIRLVGGIFLCYLGARAMLSTPKEQSRGDSESRLIRDFSSTFFLAITNPMAILYFAAIFSTLAGTTIRDYTTSGFFVTGVFLGSLLWWVILSGLTGFFIHRLNARKIRIANMISGIVIVCFGAYFLLSLLNI